MEERARVFDNFADADAADREFYRRLTPQQRLDMLLEMVERYNRAHGYSERLERVYRIVELPRR